MPVRLVVFDFDGTLAETRVAVSTTLNEALRAHGLPRVHPPFIHMLMGLPLETLVRRLVPPTVEGFEPAPVVAWYRQHFAELGEPLVTLLDGAEELVDAVSRQGSALALATSREGSSLGRLLRRLGLEGRFASVATCDRVTRGKPAPDLLELALREAGVAAADALMVGDTVWDVQMASACGVRAIGLTTGGHPGAGLSEAGAIAVFDQLRDLRTWLETALPG